MNREVVKILVSMVIILITSGSVSAMSHDHPASHDEVSPFEKKIELPRHCFLKGHSLHNPCPHLKKESFKLFTIASNCGGVPYKKQTAPGGSKTQKVFTESGKYPDLPNHYPFRTTIPPFSFIFSSPFFHPPRFV